MGRYSSLFRSLNESSATIRRACIWRVGPSFASEFLIVRARATVYSVEVTI